METRANFVLIGAFTLLVALGLLGFGLWAAKFSSDRNWQQYQVVFSEAVTGLSVGSPVQYNGIAVGSITDLALDPNDPRKVIAQLRLNASTPVKTDTQAKLAISSTFFPACANPIPKFAQVVVLPTPPFWLAMAMICVFNDFTSFLNCSMASGNRKSRHFKN